MYSWWFNSFIHHCHKISACSGQAQRGEWVAFRRSWNFCYLVIKGSEEWIYFLSRISAGNSWWNWNVSGISLFSPCLLVTWCYLWGGCGALQPLYPRRQCKGARTKVQKLEHLGSSALNKLGLYAQRVKAESGIISDLREEPVGQLDFLP